MAADAFDNHHVIPGTYQQLRLTIKGLHGCFRLCPRCERQLPNSRRTWRSHSAVGRTVVGTCDKTSPFLRLCDVLVPRSGQGVDRTAPSCQGQSPPIRLQTTLRRGVRRLHNQAHCYRCRLPNEVETDEPSSAAGMYGATCRLGQRDPDITISSVIVSRDDGKRSRSVCPPRPSCRSSLTGGEPSAGLACGVRRDRRRTHCTAIPPSSIPRSLRRAGARAASGSNAAGSVPDQGLPPALAGDQRLGAEQALRAHDRRALSTQGR